MTTFTTFQPASNSVFQFNATLDGSQFVVRVPWLFFGRRWYVEIYDQNQTLIVNRALVGSPPAAPIASVTWANRVVTVETTIPHGYTVGETVMLAITGITPTAYNGEVEAFITGDSAFTYQLAMNPGVPGAVNSGAAAEAFDISLTEGYFTSTMVYREVTGVFEVSP